METQLAIVWVLIALAGAYVLRATWRTWSGRSAGCGTGGCGKCVEEPKPEPPGKRIPLGQVEADGRRR